MSDEPDLTELITRVRNGDEHAFETVYRMVGPAIYRYLSRRISTSDVDDVFQEAMTSVFEAISTLESRPTNFLALSLTIARNCLADHYRSQKRRQSQQIEDPECQMAPKQNHTRHMDVLDALSQLSSQQRDLLLYQYFCSYSVKEIAHILDEPIPRVRYQQDLARKNLADLLRSYQVIHSDQPR